MNKIADDTGRLLAVAPTAACIVESKGEPVNVIQLLLVLLLLLFEFDCC